MAAQRHDPASISVLLAAGARFQRDVSTGTPFHAVMHDPRRNDDTALATCQALMKAADSEKYLDKRRKGDETTALALALFP